MSFDVVIQKRYLLMILHCPFVNPYRALNNFELDITLPKKHSDELTL